MRTPPGRIGRIRFIPAASGALGLLVAMGACSAGDSPRGEAAVEAVGQRGAKLGIETAPATVAFEFDLDGRHIELSLEQSRPPTASDYRTFRRTREGQLVAQPPADLGCFYRGTTEVVGVGDSSGFAAMSVCANATAHTTGRAVDGVLRAGGRLWRLSPDPLDTNESDGVDHVAEPMRRPDADGLVSDEVRRVTLQRLPESPVPRLAFREGTEQETKYIDLIAVNDAERFEALGEDTEATTLQFVDAMNALLEGSGLSPRLRVTLRAQVSFDQDPYVPAFEADEVDNRSLLAEFLDWGANEVLPEHDEHMLLSGYDFVGGVVGYAGVAVACSNESNGFIVQAGRASGGFAVLSAVHELGHTLGMNHDGTRADCPQSGFIMAAVGCGNCGIDDSAFSPCSIEQFQNFLDGPGYTGTRCADDVPTGTFPSCGDGAVQDGETCDCGSNDCSDIDPCCDGETCQLQGDAECSDFNDGCCRNCTIVSADDAVVCRAARSSCDVVETCNGSSEQCPVDTFEAAGGACEDARGNAGACYFGHCRSRGTQCEDIAEQQANNPQFPDDVGAPHPNCDTRCDVAMCGTGTNGCLTITNIAAIDGVRCDDAGQCVDGQCVPSIDQCPDDPDKANPGACGCGISDADTDDDGSADCEDGCVDDPSKQAPGQCGCGNADADADADGAADCTDGCPSDANKSEPGDCGCGQVDTDTDADGAADCIDECPDDSRRRTPGACGCGAPETDTDFDGTPDCIDGCITDTARATPPCTVAGGTDTDGDGDVDIASVSGSVRSKGSCAFAAPGAERTTGLSRMLGAVSALALLALPLWRRRRHA